MAISIPNDVSLILNKLILNGHEAFIVGGCVRDSVMDVMPKDWDITTSARPEQVAAIFERTFETGIQHGTITVLIGQQGYEVTTYRIDGEYLDNRRPESVLFTTNIKEDLSRRDFTMNAIAYNPEYGFVDPFDGKGDIGRKIIRCVGVADCRFKEDALRMLRAVRFAGQLGFMVDDTVLSAICLRRHNLADISAERIREEMVKLITSPNVAAISLLKSSGLLPYVLARYTYRGEIEKTIGFLANCPEETNLRLAIFFAQSGEDSGEIMRGLRFDNKTIKEVRLYISLLHEDIIHSRYEIKKILRQMPQVHKDEKCPRQAAQIYFENLLTLKAIVHPHKAGKFEAIRQEARDIQASGECYTLRDLPINGEDLAAAGVPHGKEIGVKLEEILDTVMRDPTQILMYNMYKRNVKD